MCSRIQASSLVLLVILCSAVVALITNTLGHTPRADGLGRVVLTHTCQSSRGAKPASEVRIDTVGKKAR